MSKLSELGIIGGIIGFLSLLMVPIMLLNTLGGIVSGVWLAILGEWWAIGYGIILLLLSMFV